MWWVAAIEGLSSQKGCARLVVRNFDKNGSREGRLATDCISRCLAMEARVTGSTRCDLAAQCWVGDCRAGSTAETELRQAQ